VSLNDTERDELRRLREDMNAAAERAAAQYHEGACIYKQELEAVRRENEQLRKALRFYAIEPEGDEGHVARAALASVHEETKT
jgi:hypothetical protein